MTRSNPRAETTRGVSRGKSHLFRFLVFCLPLCVFVLAEMLLRLLGFGGYPAFLREAGRLSSGETLCLVEPAASKPYFFANPTRPGYADQTTFVMPKPADTVRIFLVGESAAKGYPQPRNLAMSSFLQAMLADVLPGRNVEVINMGTTAVASFPLVYMVKDALKFDPDLFVFYLGNNEFFGAYGTASLNAVGTMSPRVLRVWRALRGLAVTQALGSWLHGRPQENRTLMEEMIGRIVIGKDSPLRKAAARNLAVNLGAMLDHLDAASVPAIVCTTAGNEAGLAPLGGDVSGETNSSARALFLRAQELLTQGDREAAKATFLAARDADTMPWRPTSATEEAVREAARQAGAVFCDVAEILRSESPDGVIGWEFMDDHVHLSLKGQARVAQAIAEAMTELPPPWRISPEALEGLADWKTHAQRLGANFYDDYRVKHTLRVLFGVDFMKRARPEAFERYKRACRQAEAGMSPAVLAAAREWQTMRPHAGGLRPLTAMVARVLLQENNTAEALWLYEIAQRQVPEYTSWYIEYVYFALACRERLAGGLSEGEREAAMRAIAQGEFLLAHGDAESGLTERYVGRLHQLRGEWREAIPFLLSARSRLTAEDRVACDHALIVSYAKTGQQEEALALADEGVRAGMRFEDIYRRLRAEVQSGRWNRSPASHQNANDL